MFNDIDAKKKKIDEKRPLDKHQVWQLKKYFDVEFTYNTNAIEGNTLNINETKVVLEDGITVGKGKTIKEHLEAINHKEAMDFLEEYVRQREDLTEKFIRDLHTLILNNIDKENPGKYRQKNVTISGSQHKPLDHFKIPEQMKDMIDWYHEKKYKLHPVELSVYLHHRFTYVHPFIDGNGRVGRLLMNFVLLRNGYPLAVIKAKDRERYMEALEKASVNGDYSALFEVVKKALEDSFEIYFHVLEIK